jgi:membrane-bound lytic murein transglycosylase D
VDRAVQSGGTSDFWDLATRGFLRHETKSFVPAILAAAILSKSPGAFGLSEETDRAAACASLEVDTPTDLQVIAACAGCGAEEIVSLNPALKGGRTPDGTYSVQVPAEVAERARMNLAAIPPEKRTLYHHHRLVGGDTLGALARKYGTTVRAIQDANGMGRSTKLAAGKSLRIPAAGSALVADLSTAAKLRGGNATWSGTHRAELIE